MVRRIVLPLFIILALAGCTGSEGDGGPAGRVGDNPAGIYEIVMQYPIAGSVPSDLQMIEDALNLRIENELGVRVKFYPVDASEINSVTTLKVSSGEKLDLMISMFEGGISSYVNRGMVIPLDDLIGEYGADIIESQGMTMSGGIFQDRLYGIPTEEKLGRVNAFSARRDLVEKYSIEYDPDHIYSYEDLSGIFAKVKAGEGEDFYCVAINSRDRPLFYYTDPADFLGSSLASGCLPNHGAESAGIINYYESEGFAEACRYARDWYEKGYFAPDCNTTTETSLGLLLSGNYFGMFTHAELDMVASHSNALRRSLDTGVVPFYTSVPSSMTQHYQITLWAIPVTCENPEKTMQWLNLMYADRDIINLLRFGIEGIHWNFAEGSDTVITSVEGAPSHASPYNVWGDKSKNYVRVPLDETYYQKLREFNESIDKISYALGYSFNNEPVGKEYAAVLDVIDTYQANLALGVVDPDAIIPPFISALKEAGIEEVIAENQKQFDAWLNQSGLRRPR